jgi:hypothetical protein
MLARAATAEPAAADVAAPRRERAPLRPRAGGPLTPASILALQRTAGNAAVGRLLRTPAAACECQEEGGSPGHACTCGEGKAKQPPGGEALLDDDVDGAE